MSRVLFTFSNYDCELKFDKKNNKVIANLITGQLNIEFQK